MGAAPSPWQPPLNSDANIAATQFVAKAIKEKTFSPRLQPTSFTPQVQGTPLKKYFRNTERIHTTKQTSRVCILHRHQESHRPAPPADSGLT